MLQRFVNNIYSKVLKQSSGILKNVAQKYPEAVLFISFS